MESGKQAIIVFGLGFLIFLAVRPRPKKTLSPTKNAVKEEDPEYRGFIEEPTMDKKDAKRNPQAAKAFGILRSYVKAYNAKEPQTVLDELNKEFSKTHGFTVYRRREDNKLAVKNLQGKDVIAIR